MVSDEGRKGDRETGREGGKESRNDVMASTRKAMPANHVSIGMHQIRIKKKRSKQRKEEVTNERLTHHLSRPTACVLPPRRRPTPTEQRPGPNLVRGEGQRHCGCWEGMAGVAGGNGTTRALIKAPACLVLMKEGSDEAVFCKRLLRVRKGGRFPAVPVRAWYVEYHDEEER